MSFALGRVELAGLHQGRLIGFDLAVEEFDAGEQMDRVLHFRGAGSLVFCVRRSGRLVARRLIDFVEEVQVLVQIKDVGNVGDELIAIAHQRVLRLLGGRLALAGQDHGAHLERSLSDVRDNEIGLKGPQAAALVLAHHELEMVLARRKDESGGVLNVFAPHFLRGVERQFYCLAHASDRAFQLVEHCADDVQRSFVLIAALGERNLRSGHHQRYRHVKPAVVQAEV